MIGSIRRALISKSRFSARDARQCFKKAAVAKAPLTTGGREPLLFPFKTFSNKRSCFDVRPFCQRAKRPRR